MLIDLYLFQLPIFRIIVVLTFMYAMDTVWFLKSLLMEAGSASSRFGTVVSDFLDRRDLPPTCHYLLLRGHAVPSSAPPKHILRSHGDQIASLYISDDNERLYSGDITGLVALTATRTLRALVSWKAHANAILTVKEWEGVGRYIIS
jgi:hypothetical protein